jgi:hypothetical protein
MAAGRQILRKLTQIIVGKHTIAWAEAHLIADFGLRIGDLEMKKGRIWN